MSFNTIGQYVANHKVWDHVGNAIPVVEFSEGIRPAGEFMPAAWLPVKFYEKFYENWIVIMPGKVVGMDNDGRLVPAGLGLTGSTITYTTNDVVAGTIDVTTGAACTATSIGISPITLSGVTTFMGRTGVTLAISKPVGVAPYAFLAWAGDGSCDDDGTNPAAYKQHNYNMQHRVALLCDYVLELPLVPAATATAALAAASYANNVCTFTALSNLPVAKNTTRTPTTFANYSFSGASTHFVNQVSKLTDISALGDWFINLDTGVVSCYYASDPGTSGTAFYITYSNYASAPTGTNVSVFACVLGNAKPGDFLKYNVDSNFVVATTHTYGTDEAASYDDFSVIMGQVLDREVWPKDMLQYVRTAFASINSSATGAYPGSAGQMDQMAGTADGGVPVKVNYAGAADTVVRVNLISR